MDFIIEHLYDDAAMGWLDKSRRLWKFKLKVMGSTSIEKSFWSKNKCPGSWQLKDHPWQLEGQGVIMN